VKPNSVRVVYLNPIGGLGGAELSLLDLLAAINVQRPGLDLHLVICAGGPLIERARQLGVQVHLLPMPSIMMGLGDSSLNANHKLVSLFGLALRSLPAVAQTYLYALRLRRLLTQLSPDLIHSNGIKTHCLLFIARPGRVPVIWHVRDFLGSRALMSRALRLVSRRVDAAVAVSEAVRLDIKKLIPKLPVETVYDAIDTARFCPGADDGSELDRQAGLQPSEAPILRVGLVATYARWKGHMLFLDAAARLTAKRPDLSIRYFIVGGPIYHTSGSQFSAAELSARIASAGLTGRAGLIPFQMEPAAVYRMLDVVVHASTEPEPFGRTIVEAMACGRTVVVSRAGGSVELFEEGHDAVSFGRGDVDGLVTALEGLVTDSNRRFRIAAAGRTSAVERFSHPRLGRAVLDLYDRLCARARATSS
jgi:glycosyltransferase involved in cell wall biosynthesis